MYGPDPRQASPGQSYPPQASPGQPYQPYRAPFQDPFPQPPTAPPSMAPPSPRAGGFGTGPGGRARGPARPRRSRVYALAAAAVAGVIVLLVAAVGLVARGGGGGGAEAARDGRQEPQGFVNGAADQQRGGDAADAGGAARQPAAAEADPDAETAQVRLVGPARATAGRAIRVVAAFRDLPEGARLRAYVQALRPDGRVGATKAAATCRLDTPGADDGTLTGSCPAVAAGSYRLAVMVERATQRTGDFPPVDVGRLVVAAPGAEGTSAAAAPRGGGVPAPDAVLAVERRMVELTNQARREAGVEPLSTDARLTETSRAWSCDMAGAEDLRHDPNFADSGAQGENVAFRTDPGDDVALLLHNQFMNSPGHRENLLNPRWGELGIGFCARNGFWVTERFAP